MSDQLLGKLQHFFPDFSLFACLVPTILVVASSCIYFNEHLDVIFDLSVLITNYKIISIFKTNLMEILWE